MSHSTNAPDPHNNDWFGENETRDWKSKMKKQRQDAMLNPDADMVRNSKYMSGCMLWAAVIAVCILLVAGAMALAITWLS